MKKIYLLSVVTFLTAALFSFVAGCGGGGSSAQTGTLNVALTDAPSGNFDAVYVTVSKVRVHQSATASENDLGWTDIVLNPARKINLLNLANGTLEDLGQIPLAAGHYTQLRLVLVANTGGGTPANSVVLQGTTDEIPLVTPSAVQSGIKLINEFDVAAGQRVDLVLDFDASKSVVTRGNGVYALKPVVRVVPTALNGIDGFIASSLLGSNVSITAQVNGTVAGSTVPNPQTGEFFLARLTPGNYDVVITADGHATAVIAGVPVVTTTSVTTVSTASAPITLPSSPERTISGTVVLNPPSSTEAATVAAEQDIGGVTVTVQSQTADLLTGAYTLTLPTEAPLFGPYGTGVLPILFAAQSGAAGKYTAVCSATGYQTQSVPADISLANAVQNFTLVP